MIFRNSGVVCPLITPPGRQRPDGSPPPNAARRAFTRSAAHVWYGKPLSRLKPMLTNSCGTFMSWQPSGGQGLLSSGAHMPEKSGLPSAVLGVGAFKSAFPAAVLGTPAVGYCSHCAD